MDTSKGVNTTYAGSTWGDILSELLQGFSSIGYTDGISYDSSEAIFDE